MERKILDAAEDFAICTFNPDGILDFWSRGAEKIFGFSSAEMLGKEFQSLFPEAEKKLIEKHLKSAIENGKAEIHGSRLHQNGSSISVEGTLSPISDEQNGLSGFVEILRKSPKASVAAESNPQNMLSTAILDNLKDYAIYTTNAEGTILSWNQAAAKLFGYKPEEAIGQHIRICYPADFEQNRITEELKQLRLKGKIDYSGWRARKGGAQFYSTGVASNFKFEGTVQNLFIAFDYTKKREAEQELLERDSFMRAMLDGITGFAIFSVNTDGMIETWNEGAVNVFGCKASNAVGTDYRRFYVEEDIKSSVPERDMQTAAKLGICESTSFKLRSGQEKFLANLVMTPVLGENETVKSFVIVVRDETERMKFQEELRQRDSFMRAMFDAITDFALYSIDDSGVIENWNIGAQRVFLSDANHAIGKDFRIFYENDFLGSGELEQSFEDARTKGRSQLSGWRLRADGSRFYANDVMTPVSSENGSVIRFVKVVSDITDMVNQAEKESLQRAKIEELVRHLSDVSANISSVTSQLMELSERSESVVNLTMNAVGQVRKTAESSSEQAKRVSAESFRVLDVSTQGLKSTQDTINGMNQIKNQVSAISKCMVKLTAQSNTISDIITAVDDIAQQSSLLAINAQIEAAKAGEAGIGFEVVARHVKDLAQQSRVATANVRNVLGDVVKATVEAKKATDAGGEAADGGFKQANSAGEAIATLTKSIEAAAEASREIEISGQQQLTEMHQVETAIASVKSASNETKLCSQALSNSTEKLVDIGKQLLDVLTNDDKQNEKNSLVRQL
jgi:PAS domain S-box-containing protein